MLSIKNIDCFDLLSELQDKSIDFITIDPPYNILTGHKIETKIDIPKLFLEFKRVLKDNAFISFFGQMPTVIDWINECNKHFFYSDHIVWAKRIITSTYLPLQRTHESIYIYKTSKSCKYYETEERYEDLKTPALHLGLYELASIKSIISDLQRRLNDRKYDDLYFSGLPTEKTNYDGFLKSLKNQKLELNSVNGKRNDSMIAKMYGNTNKDIFDNYPVSNKLSFRYVSKAYANITNLWSFLPQNQTKFGEKGENHKHPTVKPVLLLERLLKLCLPEPTDEFKPIVLDCFLGSGTTVIACQNLGYDFVGCELDKEYYNNILLRLENNKKGKLF
jgi:site-specific DNA-methyltransferase (adenine-specific)